MPYYTPSTSAIERSPLYPTGTPTIVCVSCGDTMKRYRTIAKRGVRPEQFIFLFLCPSCKRVDNKEVTRAA
jgi:Zn ribbon nucleic-acid-binding protein